MLTSDDLVITPLIEFYKDVIYNTMWNNWIEDGRLNPSNEKSVEHFKEETYLALSNLIIEEFDSMKYGSIVYDQNQSYQPMELDLTKLENS